MSIGIIKHIESTITYLQNSLWDGFNNDYNGRSFRLKKNDRVRPEIYPGTSNESEDVYLSDKVDSIVHFDLDPVIPKNGNYGALSNVNIIFAINIGKIYADVNRAIAVEKAKYDINRVLVTSPFDVQNIVEYPDALNDYDVDPKDEHKFNMQPYFVVKFECTCNYSLNNICEPVTPSRFELTISDNGNGTTEPFKNDSQEYNKNQIVPLNATPDPGFKFVKWLINGVQDLASLTYVKMTNNISAIAEFAVSVIKQLTIAVSGNGTTSPVPGNYDYEAGTIVPITAIENDELYYFNKFTVNGVDNTNNPIAPQINENTTVVAYFNEYSQWVFDNLIGKVGDSYYFLDKTSNGNNIKIKNTQLAKFNGISSEIDAGVNDTTQFGYQIDLLIIYNSIIHNRGLIGRFFQQDSIRVASSNTINLYIGNSPLIGIPLLSSFVEGNAYMISVRYDNRLLSDNLKLYINNVLNFTADLTSIIGNTTSKWAVGNIGVFPQGNSFYNGLMSQCKLCDVDGNVLFDYVFKEGGLNKIYDRSGNNKTGTAIGINVLDFWSQKSDLIIPDLLIDGYERFESDTTPGDYIDVIFANGVAQSPTIPGYSLKETIQPNAGFSNTGNTLDGIQIAGLETDATFAEVFALETTSDYEITKTATEVTQLKIK